MLFCDILWNHKDRKHILFCGTFQGRSAEAFLQSVQSCRAAWNVRRLHHQLVTHPQLMRRSVQRHLQPPCTVIIIILTCPITPCRRSQVRRPRRLFRSTRRPPRRPCSRPPWFMAWCCIRRPWRQRLRQGGEQRSAPAEVPSMPVCRRR